MVSGGVFSNQDPEFVRIYERSVSLGRMAKATDILASVFLLVSDHSGYITGSSITIDGGYKAI